MKQGDDPKDFTVDEVNDHLAGADTDERKRVLDAESKGKQRVGILEGPYAATGTEEPEAAATGTEEPEAAGTEEGSDEAADDEDEVTYFDSHTGRPIDKESGHGPVYVGGVEVLAASDSAGVVGTGSSPVKPSDGEKK